MTAPGRGPGPGRRSSSALGAVIIGLAVIVGIVGLQILDDSGNTTATTPAATGSTVATTGPTGTTSADAPSTRCGSSDVQGAGQRSPTSSALTATTRWSRPNFGSAPEGHRRAVP